MSNRFSSSLLPPVAILAVSCAAAAMPLLAQAQAAARADVMRYEVLRKELLLGLPVTAIFSPSQCTGGQTTGNKATAPLIHGGFSVRDFMEVEGNNIGFANQHMTLRPDGTPVLELAQYRITPDDKVTVTVSFLSPLTYQAVSVPQTFQCAIGAGLDFAIARAGSLHR